MDSAADMLYLSVFRLEMVSNRYEGYFVVVVVDLLLLTLFENP